MRTIARLIATLVALCVLAALTTVGADDAAAKTGAASAWDGESHVLHEWGTFTTLQGSDGVVLDGLRHEERDLPEFVHDIRDFTGVTGVSPKMETPVIYFYSPDERKVSVRVQFPRGVVTQWYPAANGVNYMGAMLNGVPRAVADAVIETLRDGWICWGRRSELTVLGRDDDSALPRVSRADPWRFCREVDANTLRTCSLNLARKNTARKNTARKNTAQRPPERVEYEHEKCLFYRGLGDFDLPFEGRVRRERVTSDRYEASIHLRNQKPGEALEHVFLVWVGDGRCGFSYLRKLDRERTIDVSFPLAPVRASTERLVEALAAKLTMTGLYRKEALAMARTWQQGYFQDEGLRALYVLPRSFIDRELPLRIDHVRSRHGKSKAAKAVEWRVVRTFVGRTELLSPERESALDAVVADFARGDATARARAEETLGKWGRFAVPYLNRVLALTTDAQVRTAVQARLDALRLRR